MVVSYTFILAKGAERYLRSLGILPVKGIVFHSHFMGGFRLNVDHSVASPGGGINKVQIHASSSVDSEVDIGLLIFFEDVCEVGWSMLVKHGWEAIS